MKILINRIIKKYPRFKNLIKFFLFQIKKGYIKQIIHYILKGHFFRKLIVTNYLNKNKIKKLQIGGGYHTKKEWLNGDIIHGDIYLDASKKFPMETETFDYIFAEQFIEHISFDEGKKCINECYRILKPDGVMRIATPDIKGLISVYNNENTMVKSEEVLQRHRKNHNQNCLNLCHLFNDNFRLWGHSFIYDFETLKTLFFDAGFQNLKQVKFGHSLFVELNGLEQHADLEWMKSAYQIILEARKSHE